MEKILKGEWKSLWNKCKTKGHAHQDKLAANSLLALSRTSTQTGAMAQKKARAGNLSKANQIAQFTNMHLGTTRCTNYRKRHQ